MAVGEEDEAQTGDVNSKEEQQVQRASDYPQECDYPAILDTNRLLQT